MPRNPRIISSSGIYHIILRSVNQHIIFEEDADYRKFLYILSDCKAKYDTDIYAYCLMDNHVHMLFRSKPESLSSFFQSLGTRFVRWYNSKYSRCGHLFQERFHSSSIENRSHFLAALVYIHNNPVKANIVRYPSEYRWSSYNAFLGQKNPLINTAYAYGIAGSKDSLLKFFASNDTNKIEAYFTNDHKKVAHFLTDEQALSIFKETTNLSSASDVGRLPKTMRNQCIRLLYQKNLTQKQISRLMDVSVSTVKRVCLK